MSWWKSVRSSHFGTVQALFIISDEKRESLRRLKELINTNHCFPVVEDGNLLVLEVPETMQQGSNEESSMNNGIDDQEDNVIMLFDDSDNDNDGNIN